MKKTSLIILTIILVATMMLTFVGCSSETVQGQLRDIWRPYEKYVYDVTDGTATGTYTVEIIRNTASTITIGDNKLEDVKEGYIFKSVLKFDGEVWESQCYVQSVDGATFQVPIASYYKRVGGGYEDTLSAKYDGNKYSYKITDYGAERKGELTLKAPFYDNGQLHQLFRSVKNLGTTFRFSFSTPIPSEGEIATLSASCGETQKVAWGDNKEANCNKVILARSTKVAGASHTLYYSADPIEVNGWKLENVLVSFKEPMANNQSMVYTLKSISLTPEVDD